jgi:signal transduction histidine kinase
MFFNLKLLCRDIAPEYFGWINFSGVPEILFYAYIPSIVVILLVAIFVYKNRKEKTDIPSNYLLSLSVFSLMWFIVTILQWISVSVSVNVFAWDIIGIFEILVYFFSYCFFISFLTKKDLTNKNKIILGIILLPVIIMSFFDILNNFNINECNGYYNLFYTTYIYAYETLTAIAVLFFGIKHFRSTNSLVDRSQGVLITFSVFLFLTIFTVSSIVGEVTLIYGVNLIGPIGLVIFVATLSYLIVHFRAFNIKLLGAQVLVWAMVILIGSQFLFIQSNINKVLNSITFIFVSLSGLILVRSIKKVDHQKELLDMANKNQQSLLHFITHQVKGFMTKSRGIFAGMLEGDYGDINGKVREMADYGLKSETKAVETIQNILHASDLKSGVVEFSKKEFDLTYLVREVIEDSRMKAQEKGIEIEQNISSKPIMFNGDENKMREVCKNLIDNSIIYTLHGKISITLKVVGDYVRFSVRDTGVGLSEDDKINLFNEGGRGKESLLHNVDSTGYGLFIAKQIVLEHKGKIWAESSGPDKGSEFIIELPK